MFAACNGTGSLPGTDCKMNGFNNEPTYGGPQEPAIRPLYRRAEWKPYFSTWRTSGLSPTKCSSRTDRELRRASVRYRRASPVSMSIYRASLLWGCAGGKYDTVSTRSPRVASPTAPQQARFDYQTPPATSSTKRTYRGVTRRATATMPYGNGGTWSAYQAVRHIFRSRDGGKGHLDRIKISLTCAPVR